MVDEHGELLDGDDLLFIIARHRQAAGILKGGVVGTLMTNFGLERALADLNIPFLRAKVGDRYVLEDLRTRGWLVGGEASGHIICLDLNTTGDGIVSALQVLVPLVEGGVSLSELKRGMTKLPQTIVNVSSDAPQTVIAVARVADAVCRAESTLAERGRVLLRASGTEPLVRVMVEGEDQQEVDRVAEALADEVRAAARP